MIEEVYDTFNEKKAKLSTYYVINNDVIYSTSDENYEENLENCYYIKKIGSNVHPKMYVSQKSNYKWLEKKEILYSYYELINLICENNNIIICIRGFNRSSMTRIISVLNSTRNKNITFPNLKNKRIKIKDELPIKDEEENTKIKSKVKQKLFADSER